ncbi:cytochrome c-type biogenesis protein CcmF [Luminiphilus syltensis NOR5-1B]|uniref:Cytochrome c-type biogenesis protein CcmF n=1 Tax=Luminiphilus syltensis NOR5-1B TaxID=565045 RepID=B8KS77_9GAMM|nr:heme lyase CcmF/NrfE family subunit [Luminiphilus syltensis]EED34162.1 cytochrome c-type biogenesis protein CcmF [Luminiphilus syltensis NOR5-1B]
MTPEFGHLALIIAFTLACLLGTVPLWGAWRRDTLAMNLAPSLALGVCVFLAIAFGFLTYAFLQDDFSVKVVASNSNSLLPSVYKFSAVWGNHEGSLLLWVLILSGWMTAVAFFSRGLPLPVLSRVLGVMGLVAVGFIAFSLFTSNPFERLLPGSPVEGNDLNPLLQDPGLIIHPPLLYMGYVGFSVPFAFAIAALLGGRLDAAWARWSRPWTNVAWGFLSLGIMLGSWWAYYELGWGGWWFWDPVENASFMPWLTGTALVHSLAVTEKRGLFRSWTVLLAIAAFSLSLLGTFLVRSGVLTSVHAFASDPERGLFILIFLGVVVGGSLVLYALRAPTVASRVHYGPLSREALLLFNNLVFCVATLTVLLGTLFPLVMDAAGQGKYSVGPPYFNAVFVPLMALLLPFMGIGPLSRWKRDTVARWWQELLLPAVTVVLLAALLPLFGREYNLWIALAVLLAGWVVLSLARDLRNRTAVVRGIRAKLARLSPSYLGMVMGHCGFAAMVLGAVVVTQLSIERDLKMVVGDSQTVSGYRFDFERLDRVDGPNFSADQATFSVWDGDTQIATLTPQKRRYIASNQIMTEAAIDAGLMRDLYVAMGEPVGNDGWAIRLQYKPMIRWIWLGALVIGIGGLVTALDKRYRAQRSAVTANAGVADAAT